MFMHLPAQGVRPSAREVADYIALFRYVAHVIGAPTAPFATPRSARVTMESLIARLEVTPTSRTVGANFARALEDWPPLNPSRAFIEAGIRWMNGHELCDVLGIGRPGWYYYAVMMGHCGVGWCLAWATRLVPALDRRVIAVSHALSPFLSTTCLVDEGHAALMDRSTSATCSGTLSWRANPAWALPPRSSFSTCRRKARCCRCLVARRCRQNRQRDSSSGPFLVSSSLAVFWL